VSVVIPPRGYEAAALEKMIADGARGIIFLPHDVDSKTLSRATGHAATIIALEDHPHARICPRTSQPVFSPTGVSAFHLPRGDLPQRIIPASAEWRARLPVCWVGNGSLV
jgi:hypothetical protein